MEFEMRPIEQVQSEAEAFFEREDVEALFQEVMKMSIEMSNYRISKKHWSLISKEPYPSKKKIDTLLELHSDMYNTAAALNRRIKSIKLKD